MYVTSYIFKISYKGSKKHKKTFSRFMQSDSGHVIVKNHIHKVIDHAWCNIRTEKKYGVYFWLYEIFIQKMYKWLIYSSNGHSWKIFGITGSYVFKNEKSAINWKMLL